VIYSGLDWSGSPGRAHGPSVAFAIVHVDGADVQALDAELASARHRLHVVPDYVFRYSGSSDRARREFFTAMQPVRFSSHVLIVDKAIWAEQQAGTPTGPKFLCDGIVTLVLHCPDKVVADHVLSIDAPPDEAKGLMHYKTEIRRALRSARPRRRGFKSVRPCPDHRLHGGIIQVADMLAGEARERGGLDGPYLAELGARITLV
jgi:hypothetical protein